MKVQASLSLFVIAVHFAACAATQTYSGPRREPHEVGTVYFYNLQGVALSGLSVDGVDQGFGIGLEVLPGKHSVEVEYQNKDQDCSYSYGRETWCTEISYTGLCSGTIRTEAGRDYRIEVSGISESAWISMMEEDSREVAGSGSCQMYEYGGNFSFQPRRR